MKELCLHGFDEKMDNPEGFKTALSSFSLYKGDGNKDKKKLGFIRVVNHISDKNKKLPS